MSKKTCETWPQLFKKEANANEKPKVVEKVCYLKMIRYVHNLSTLYV